MQVMFRLSAQTSFLKKVKLMQLFRTWGKKSQDLHKIRRKSFICKQRKCSFTTMAHLSYWKLKAHIVSKTNLVLQV